MNNPIDNLIKILNSLPGVGSRSARRIALHLITSKTNAMLQLSNAIDSVENNIKKCDLCNNVDICNPCNICNSEKRDHKLICVVSNIMDLWAIERSGNYKGIYHVLGGVLSAIDGIGLEDIDLSGLVNKVQDSDISEIIIALSATVDGQSTSHVICDKLYGLGDFKITRLAHGMPIGGELDYLDDGTIITAFKARSKL